MNTEAILAMFGLPGGAEWVLILLAALLIFGRRLPEVARSIGRSIVEFKKGVRDIRDEVDHESQAPPSDRLNRQTPAAISQQSSNAPINEPASAADATPVAPAPSSAAATPPAPTTEPHAAPVAPSPPAPTTEADTSHAAPVAPSSPTPQSNDS